MSDSVYRLRKSLLFAALLLIPGLVCRAQENRNARKQVILENAAARLMVDLGGGAIGEFRLRAMEVNPLNWAAPKPGETAIRGFGHFLCLDRWGPPSATEGARGMPYHGEAANVAWTLVRGPVELEGSFEAQMSADLPRVGFSVRRTIRMSSRAASFVVREEVTNNHALGRIYNMVQHPTVAPPFLDEATLVDCNGGRGFAQGAEGTKPWEQALPWPRARGESGSEVDLRRLMRDPSPNVVSFLIDEPYGWVTAVSPSSGLMIGYVWRTSDYPWVSLWRDVRDARPAARGLEFGTTGLHQPFPILVKQGRIWDRPVFEYLDAGETATRSYSAFLLAVPKDCGGVASIRVEKERLVVSERDGPGRDREWTVDISGLGW